MLKKIILFGLMTVMCSVIIVSAYEDKFPRVAYDPPYNPSIGFNPCFPQAESLGLTGLIGPAFNYPADWDAAVTHHLNLVSSWIERFSWGQYSMYQADRHNEYDWFQPYDLYNQIRFLSTKYDNAGHGRQIQDTTIHDTTVYAWFVSKDNPNDNRGYVLYDLWNERTGPFKISDYAIDYSREQDRDSGLVYNVIFKLKYPKDATYSSDDTVARLQAYFCDGHTGDTIILAESLLVYDTIIAGQYDTFRLTFERPLYHPSDSFDYKVYWYKQTDLYIDYAEVFDSHYDLLFNVKSCSTCATTIYEDSLINDWYVNLVESNYKGTSLYRWYLKDQPSYDQFRSSRRVNEILASLNYTPGIQAAGDFLYINTYRYMNELYPYPHELFYDDYPIIRNRTPENNNESWQATLDSFAVRLSKVANTTETKGKEWWYCADAYWEALYPNIYRYPHNNELKATVYMALAYGAKGVGYFRYASYWRNDSLILGGLVDTSGIPVETYPYNDYYAGTNEYLFDAVKQINQKLDTLGPILKKLEWKWAGSGDSVQNAPGSFVYSLNGVECALCGYPTCKYPIYQNHIQVGMFKDDSLSEDYLMLVNRWVGYTEKPCEEVSLQKGRISYLIDCSTNEVLDTLPGDGTFHTILNPGEGKLFRLANFLKSNLSGSRQSSPQKINLSWTDPNLNESGYKVWRKLADGANWFKVDSTGSNATSFSDTNLVGSETYNYRVRAFDQQYQSEYSNIVTVKNFPNPPRNLTARLNKICCSGFASGGGGMSINGICPYCYTNEIILSWQAPLNQKIGTLTQYRVRAWRGSWNHYQMVSSSYTSTTFCVPELGKSYNFEVYAIDSVGDLSNPSNYVSITSGTTDDCEGEPQAKIIASIVPEKFELFQNYPNPFNFGTVIKYALPEESNVKIVIYNLLGQKVRVLVEDTQSPGYYTIYWDGRNDRGEDISSGIYFYRIQTGSFTKTVKMSLLK